MRRDLLYYTGQRRDVFLWAASWIRRDGFAMVPKILKDGNNVAI